MGFFDKGERIQSDSLQTLLKSLLNTDGKENINLKTDVPNVVPLAVLELYEIAYEKAGLVKCAQSLKTFNQRYKEIRVSRNGARVNNVLKAISSLMSNESLKLSISERLTQIKKKE